MKAMEPLSEHFRKCTLTPVAGSEASPSSAILSANGKWKTSSFYLDSLGRSSISLVLELNCPSKEVAEAFLSERCILPSPNQEDEESKADEEPRRWTLGIEAKVTLTFGSGEAITALVEGVTILSTHLEGRSFLFNTEIIVRISRSEGDRINSGDASGVKTSLEVSAVLSEKPTIEETTTKALDCFESLSLGGLPSLGRTLLGRRLQLQTRLPPITLHVTLTHALSISVKSISGPSMGQTFLALSIHHSGTHAQPVTVESISLHPGHSRIRESLEESAPSNQGQMTDMSQSVKWSFAPRTDPQLPLTLERHEAFSTILAVDANDDTSIRDFSCHLSVMAVLQTREASIHHVIAVTEAEYTTSRAAVEPEDAFRVDLKLEQSICTVGTPLKLAMEIYNMNAETRDITMLVSSESVDEPKTRVVCKGQGSKFGVWGLVEDGASEVVEERERELLAIDATLLLGEVKGQTSKVAELRLVPLRAGTLSVPNFTLVDKKGTRYSCSHKLKAVARAG